MASLPTSRLPQIRTQGSESAECTSTDDSMAAAEEEEPVTPTARLIEDIYIVVIIGLGSPVNLPVFSAGIATELARYARFRSIQVTDGSKDGNNPRWACKAVNVEDHMIVPALEAAAVEADPDQAVEDYVASLYRLPMDRSRPLWEFHFLDFRTSEAASTVVLRVHHSLGDGMSLITLLLASARSAADPTRLPAMPEQPVRTGAIYVPRQWQPASSCGLLVFVTWVWAYLMLAWNTMVDVAYFAATIMFLRDPHTLFTPSHGNVPSRRFVHRSLCLDDVKLIKKAMNCTVNDVLVGVTSAALSHYYFRNSGNTNTSKICLRSVLVVNTRPTPSLQTYAKLIESGKSNDVAWGNQLGYILLPFHLAMHDDPLEYVRKANKTMDRKKSSLEVILTCKTSEFFVKMFGLKAGAFIFRRMFANTTILFSNMIGPTETVELCGHPVVFIAPTVYGGPQALTVHYQSYSRTIKVVLSVDEEIFPNYNQLLDDFVNTFGHIKDAASRFHNSARKSN